MSTINEAQPISAIPKLAEREYVKGTSNLSRSLNRLRHHKMAIVGAGLLLLVFFFIVMGSFIIPEPVSRFNDPSRALLEPSVEHPFGTDVIGRDLLARVIYGGQISLFIGITAVIVQMLVGTIIGVAAGYLGGWIDAVLMRLTEAMLSIPSLFLSLIALRIFSDPTEFPDFQFMGRAYSATMIVIIFVIGLTSWMRVSRIVRSVVLSVKEQEYVTAAHAIGASSLRTVLVHVVPNCFAPMVVSATLGVASAILLEAYLGFLGLGVRAPTPTWGNIMGQANSYLNEWYFWFFPALFIMLTTLGINFLGDGLRDAFDPKSLR
jgi:peptide/nickel transport system permease protein